MALLHRLKMMAALGLALSINAPAAAVTFGPLQKSGNTASDRKGFYLNLANPYERAFEFRLFLEPGDIGLRERVKIIPSAATLRGRGKRRILVIVRDLTPGETLEFRVCAERAPQFQETVHARVCSRLTARRLG
jgi:hypothetical protein